MDIDLEPLAKEIYQVIKDYSDNLTPDEESDFISWEWADDEIRNLCFILAKFTLTRQVANLVK